MDKRMTKVVAINGSNHDGGITDQSVMSAVQAARDKGAHVEVVTLREYPIKFCLSCRECCQQPGVMPGECVHHDAMEALVTKLELADAYILASPTTYGTVSALFKRFIERLTVYGYWPWGMRMPQLRKANLTHKKKAMLLTSSAAPGFLARWFFNSHKQLAFTARLLGANSIGCVFTGRVGYSPAAVLPESSRKKTHRLVDKLI